MAEINSINSNNQVSTASSVDRALKFISESSNIDFGNTDELMDASSMVDPKKFYNNLLNMGNNVYDVV